MEVITPSITDFLAETVLGKRGVFDTTEERDASFVPLLFDKIIKSESVKNTVGLLVQSCLQ